MFYKLGEAVQLDKSKEINILWIIEGKLYTSEAIDAGDGTRSSSSKANEFHDQGEML
jgi:hypothetical protein